jgi:hypothetical protein
MNRSYYSAPIEIFLVQSAIEILGELTSAAEFDIDRTQRFAWEVQIGLLKEALAPYAGQGKVYFEYAIPRIGKRVDVIALIGSSLIVLEFKVGARDFDAGARDQVWDYALDLKNFHETSHDKTIAPVLISTSVERALTLRVEKSAIEDGVFLPMLVGQKDIGNAIRAILDWSAAPAIRAEEWEAGRYLPAPTIVEAAMALYAGHGVAEISRTDAGIKNLRATSNAVEQIISACRNQKRKAICFVTGVPGAGKTLVGLDIATRHAGSGELHGVFLSGNGPLVRVMQEALARDQVRRATVAGKKLSKTSAASQVKAFIQNVHHFRDEYLRDEGAPSDHIAVFDEAQRAWNLAQTAAFMQRKKNRPGFEKSEPEFLISCMDRHEDWAVVVCLVGGGQEINTGEAGIGEWIDAARRSFPGWEIHIAAELKDAEYGGSQLLEQSTSAHQRVRLNPDLHLAVSMRSFRAGHVSALVKHLLDVDAEGARRAHERVRDRYPIVLCRSVPRAKDWIRSQARGTERYGVMVSSQAARLRAHGIHVKAPVDPVHYFLHGKEDVRSSYYMEDVATEFHVQGLELDWTCVVWDGDLRRRGAAWEHYSFVGSRWQRIRAPERQVFQKNAYRVLLTRARQGMVIVVPEGSTEDPTRSPSFYDATYDYLTSVGFPDL